MTQKEIEQLRQDYSLYLVLLDYYARNRASVKSMTDQEYQGHIDEILDEINRIKKLLKDYDDQSVK